MSSSTAGRFLIKAIGGFNVLGKKLREQTYDLLRAN